MIAKLAIAAVLVLVAVPFQLGRSVQGRPIVAIRVGDPHGTRVLVVGCIHGTECAGIAIASALEHTPTRADLWIVPTSTRMAMPTATGRTRTVLT